VLGAAWHFRRRAGIAIAEQMLNLMQDWEKFRGSDR
jgi:hypothetical protein